GAALVVSFTATAPAGEDIYAILLELLRGEGADADTFERSGANAEVRIDGTAPNVNIDQAPPNATNSKSATFAFTASEPVSAQCKLDGGAFEPCTTPKSYANLSDGAHTFTIAATDAAGNTSQESYSWSIDARAPAAVVSSRPSALSNSRSATFAFSADEPASFQCQLDGGSFLPCGSPAAYHGLGDGPHTFTLRAIDRVGNTSGAVSYSWRIDATAPETAVDSAPRLRTTTLSATFRFSASESAVFQCRLNTGAFVACTSPKTYARLRRARHSFEVRAIDPAGNVDTTPAVHRWTIASSIRTARASALFAPRRGARVTSPPLLRWRRIRGASYYNVQLYRGGRKVLTTWPRRTALQLRTRWQFNGRVERLTPGVYTWYVWPGYGSPAARRYGRMLGTSTFVVPRASTRR
ncbi:MAG: hypothetical protein M3310_03435, partial [Actinomycetota bacterium]|nr:hypothetical protein [Actinomycetota bacterium]